MTAGQGEARSPSVRRLWGNLSRKRVVIASWAAVAIRIAVLVLVIVVFVPNEAGERASPLVMQSTTDISYYLGAAQDYFVNSEGIFGRMYDKFFVEKDLRTPTYSPPLFPFLLYAFDYRDGNTLPLALFYFVMGIITTVLWIRWLGRSGLGLPWLLTFAALPNLAWFSVSITSDLLFAFLTVVFFLSYFDQGIPRKIWIWGLALFLLLLSRSHGLSVLLFVCADAFLGVLRTRDSPQLSKVTLLFLAAITLFSVGFYLPSFNGAVNSLDRLAYFGVTSAEYASGLFSMLPSLVDNVLSRAALFSAKIFYAVGLRPSYSGTPMELVILRSAAGVFLFPGLFHLFFRAPWRIKLFTFLFLLPVVLGPAQDRYTLPIQALLFLHGVLAYLWIGRVLASRLLPGWFGPGQK